MVRPPKLVFLGDQDEILNYCDSPLHKFARIGRRGKIFLNGIKLSLKEYLQQTRLLRGLDCAKRIEHGFHTRNFRSRFVPFSIFHPLLPLDLL